MTDFNPLTPAVFVCVDFGGVTHYRTMLPARHLRASMLVRTADMAGMKLVGTENAPVVVYSMPRSTEMFDECMQILADPKRALIIDLDDCLRAVVEGGTHPNAKDWEPLLDKHEWLIGKADLVTVTTPFLKRYAEGLGAESVQIIPNGIDMDRFDRQRMPRHKDVTIVGFSGSIGHEEALEAYIPPLAELMLAHPIVLASAGLPISHLVPEEVKHRVRDLGYHPITKHPSVITQFDINIGPAMPTDFYLAKSDLRALEAMAADTLFIGDSVVYGDAITDGENGLLVDTPEQMAERVLDALAHPEWATRMRMQGMRDVKRWGTIDVTAPLWRAAVNSVLP